MERDILKEVKNLTDEEIYKLQLTDEERIVLLTHREFEKYAFYMILHNVKNRDLVFEFNERFVREKLEKKNIFPLNSPSRDNGVFGFI